MFLPLVAMPCFSRYSLLCSFALAFDALKERVSRNGLFTRCSYYLEFGIDINSLALVWICDSIAVSRSSGKLIDGCLVNVKFNSLWS